MSTAVLFDGDFFLRRYRHLKGKAPPKRVAGAVCRMARDHLARQKRPPEALYRIFFYDCPPLSHKVHNPVTKQSIDFSKSKTALWRLALHDELRRQRKVALRLGYIAHRSARWTLKANALKDLLKNQRGVADLTEDDVRYDARQKGVDMRIGLDIASMVFKGQVDQIILVSGDSDFVPAAKMARREGIDFILDPMWSSIHPQLTEHIDGLQSVFDRQPSPVNGEQTQSADQAPEQDGEESS